MKIIKNGYKSKKLFALLISTFVTLFGVFIMVIPIIDTVTISGFSFQLLLFLIIILFFLFLPSIVYCIVAIKMKNMEFVIIPAIFILVTEYYFFHDFSTWISSDPNAAIGLVIIPFYLILSLGVSYGLAFIIIKIRKLCFLKLRQ